MRKEVIIGLLLAILVAVLLAPFASSLPDGLERVAEDLGFIDAQKAPTINVALMEDYVMPGVANIQVATSLAGLFGVIITFVASYWVGKLISGKIKS
ncbi:PDGLE domain-containing protein [Calderihabitans maritimus]|uniref:PDGLE domain-containing protein n=1 Tax=Calderihabitans maritimus TaxID=1246530 RepID=A0A1Z5HT75_9FIRM|nr:PDGLE domain-containing protein [Calderihabitans maritimus]GAW92729.1 hypothetical protein Tph_c09460 [Calderihabitans maritimus]